MVDVTIRVHEDVNVLARFATVIPPVNTIVGSEAAPSGVGRPMQLIK